MTGLSASASDPVRSIGDSKFLRRLSSAARVAVLSAALVGAIHLGAWLTGFVPQLSASGVLTMKANASMGLLLAGLGLLFFLEAAPVRGTRAAGFIAGSLVFLIGIFTLAEHFFHWNLGIDQLVAHEAAGAVATESPNRMGPPGAASLTLLGLGLLALACRKDRAASYLGLVVCVINFVPAVGFLYGITEFNSTYMTGTAWPGVVSFLALGFGMAASRPASGPMSVLAKEDAGGILLRRLLPAVTLAVLVLGYLQVVADNTHFFDEGVRDGLTAIVTILVFMTLLWRGALKLSRMEAAQKLAEEATRAAERFALKVNESLITGVYIYDIQQTRHLYINPQYTQLTGYTLEDLEAMGPSFFERFHSDDRAHVEQHIKSHDGADPEIEYRLRRKSGQWIWCLAREAVFERDLRGAPVKLIGSFLDITDRRLMEEEVRRLNVELERRVSERTAQLQRLAIEMTQVEQSERLKLSRLLHDHLQQFLVAARMQLSALSQRVAPGGSNEAARKLDDLLEQSIEATRALSVELNPPVLKEQGLGPALRWLARWMEEKHGLHVEIDADCAIEQVGDAARPLVFQSVRELLFNVVKHAKVSAARVTARPEGQEFLCIAVADSGVGFDTEAVEDQESGLGLPSIRQRLEALSGTFDLESAPGEGTLVLLRIPLVAPLAPLPAEVEAPAVDEPPERRTVPDGARIRVLLVDDHPIVREGLAGIIAQQSDFELAGEAENGLVAVEEARRLQPDVIIMDVRMPKLDGIEATRLITAEQPATRIIVLSTYEEDDRADAARAAGAVAYLTKGAASEILVGAIRKAVSPAEAPVP